MEVWGESAGILKNPFGLLLQRLEETSREIFIDFFFGIS